MTFLDVLLIMMPNEMLPVVIVLAGIGLIVGLARPRSAFQLVAGLILCIISAPFVEALFAALPWWLGVGTSVLLFIWMSRAVLRFVFGREAEGHIVGALVVRSLGIAVWVAVLPFRAAFRLGARGLARTR